ncbi:NAD(P)/FAD-dependent oxidoreductase [Pseudahrensia aquimaris]|uniref:NAD(P)/FAD-dependent oxidoreductase n=1 Tax=Pseudahrensia aquimaris TaxID=744461 RepID=A0ABW3FF24_9HYPH
MIVVVGAGIAGLSLAWALLQKGADVTVLEAASVGSGASGAATCYLEPRLGTTPIRRLEWEGLQAWEDYAARLSSDSGTDVEYWREGQIRVTLAENLERFVADYDERTDYGWHVDLLSTDELLQREPMLSPDLVRAAYVPIVRWANGATVCAAMAVAIEKAGGTIKTGWSVERLETTASDVIVHSQDGGSVTAETVVFANGLGANSVAGTPEDLPVSRAVRGVNLVVDMSGAAQPIRHLIKHRDGTLCPRLGSRLIIGPTYEHGIDHHDVADDVIEMLYSRAAPIVPGLRDMPLIGVTSGIRTKIGNGQLALGRSSANPRVAFSLGHAGSGFLRAPIVGDALADYLLNGERHPLLDAVLH